MVSEKTKPTGNVLIVSATLSEIDPVLSNLKPLDSAFPEVQSYSLQNLQIDVLITGVGMVATVYALAVTLSEKRYDLIINAGVGGSLNHTYRIGEVVVVRKDSFADMGAESEPGFLDIFQLGLISESEITYYKQGLKNSSTTPYRSLAHLRVASGATVNTIHGVQKSIDDFRKRCNADIESMEGAAFYYACFRKEANCLQIRAISNFVEIRNKENWNIPLAVRNLNTVLLSLLVEITEP